MTTLLIAWAGADWRLLESLLSEGRLPNLQQVIESGVRGNLRTLQPQCPALLWTSLATGQRGDAHGLYAPATSGDDHTLKPTTRYQRRVPALWDILWRAGRSAHAINWPYSHPAESGRGVAVSELFAWVQGDPSTPAPPPVSAVQPAQQADALAELRVHPGEIGLDVLEWFVPSVRALPEKLRDPLERLAIALARNATVHACTTELLEAHPADLVVVNYDAFAVLSPYFFALHPPRLPYIAEELFRHYSGALTRMCELLDMQLGRLMELAGPEPRVVLVSERGHHCDHLRPQTPEEAAQPLGAPWVREQGILAMSGPGVRDDAERIEGAQLLDIVPTLLRLLDLPAGRDMPGRVLRHALTPMRDIPRIGGWMSEPTPSDVPLTVEETKAMIRVRQVLGELNAELPLPDPETGLIDDPELAFAARRDERLNLALHLLSEGRSGAALETLRALYDELPDDERITLHLARCLHRTGAIEEAKEMMDRVASAGPPRPREHLMLSRMHLSDGNPAQALVSLFRAEQSSPGQPELHCRIGEVYLRMKRWDEAARAFGKALKLDRDSALGHHGMAVVHLAKEEPQQAADSALSAVGLNRRSALAHFHLGVALTRLERPLEAITAFENSLALNPKHASAHQWLAALYEPYDDAKSKSHRGEAARLLVSDMLR